MSLDRVAIMSLVVKKERQECPVNLQAAARLPTALVSNAHGGQMQERELFSGRNAAFDVPMTDQYCSHPERADRKYYLTLTCSL